MKTHYRETISLAWPLVLTQLGHVITGMVDNIFLGRIGPTAQAAGILCNNMFVLLLVCNIGMSYSITPLVTEAHERADVGRKSELLKNGLLLNGLMGLGTFLLLFVFSFMLSHLGQPIEVVVLAQPFYQVLIFSIIPMSFFLVGKQFCEGLGNTRAALLISFAGNLLNIALNYALIYGKLGLPEMGYMGSAWATFCARCFMGLSFLWLLFRSQLTAEVARAFAQARIKWAVLVSLWRLGINSALQFSFEVAAFVIAGLMAGHFGKEHLDAHGISLSMAAFTYMFASGLGSSGTIRAAMFKAQNDLAGLRMACRSAIVLSLVVMSFFAMLFFIFCRIFPLLFSSDPLIVSISAVLLVIAGFFQLFDGLQVTVIGLLRGMQDVRWPTFITLLGYWIIAIPLAYFLGYTLGMQTTGIWIALLISLAFVAVAVLIRLKGVLKKLEPEV